MYNPGLSDILLTVMYVAILLWMLIHHQRLTEWRWGAGSYILTSYIIYPIVGAFWFFAPYLLYGEIEELQLFPFLYLAAMLYIATYPALKYDRLNITSIESPSMYIIYVFTIVYILCTLLQIPDMVSHMDEGLTKIMVETEAGSDLYSETMELNNDNTFTGSSFANIHIVIYNIFAQVACLLFFYYLTLEKKHYWAIIGLGCCIIIRCLTSIASGQRTEITMTIFDIIVAYGATKSMMSVQLKKIIRYALLSMGLIVAIPFLALTMSRFAERDGGINGGLVYYIGEAPYYFNMNALDAGGTRQGDRTCNVFKKLLGMSSPDGEFGVRESYPHLKMSDAVFSTFVGDFILDFGVTITTLLFVIFSAIFSMSIRCNAPNQIPLHRLLLAYFAMCVCMRGGMYLFAFSFRGNLNIIAILLFYLTLVIDYHLRHKYAKQYE